MARPRLYTDEEAFRILVDTCRDDVPPTVREYAQALGASSPRTALRYLDRLEAGGWIRRWPGARGMELLYD